MGALSLANLKKTIYYLQRNGLKNTWNAARERLEKSPAADYLWRPESPLEWRAGRNACREMLERYGEKAPLFSILVPAYHTNPVFLKELVESVKKQTYPLWELLILDASADDSVKDALEKIGGEQVRYIKLPGNDGISQNTNAGLPLAQGDYIGLLDHDDVLTADALQCMAEAILSRQPDDRPVMLYSDEDKWNGQPEGYYDPNFKEDFNLDLLLSNNYICHFLVMEAELMKSLGLRKEFDGAQDYDLVLRAADAGEDKILHIPRVLYHWRCHSASTAENPRSKTYAYEAGKRALQDYAQRHGQKALAQDLKHVGFYYLKYQEDLWLQRPDLAAVGGKVVCTKKYQTMGEERRPLFEGDSRETVAAVPAGGIIGGCMDEQGRIYYYGLKPGYSGYLNRAVLTQDALALDLRCIRVAPDLRDLFAEVVGVPYVERPEDGCFDFTTLPEQADIRGLSLAFGAALRRRGKRLLWDPALVKKV